MDDLQRQHPALAGNEGLEVSKRGGEGSGGGTFLKTFVLAGSGFDSPDHPCHAANKGRVVEEAIQRGLHAKSEPVLEETDVVPSGRRVSTYLTYAVEVVPSVIDHDPQDAVTPRDMNEGEK